MAIDFKESKTRENLMRAFAGESQARNRYTIAAEVAREQGLFAVNQVFLLLQTKSALMQSASMICLRTYRERPSILMEATR